MSHRPPFREIKEKLEKKGFRPSRKLGQNFLLDPSLLGLIVEEAGIRQGDAVFEIGSGAGFLTAHILDAGARVLGVEIDPRLVEVSMDVLGNRKDLNILNLDILDNKNELNGEVLSALRRFGGEGGIKIVANLPYSISGPVVALLSTGDLPIRVFVCLVQKELADRVVALPGTKDWGPLTISVATRFKARIVRHIHPRVFRPSPKITSALVKMVPRSKPLIRPGEEAKAFMSFVRKLFVHGKKSLKKALRLLEKQGIHVSKEDTELQGLDKKRVKELDLEELLLLWKMVRT